MSTTPQSIREKTFEKAVFGGYDMGSVDDFLESVATDFAAAQKECAVLKSKMKVLVDKIEEYRTTEDAMRMALLSAQKMANQITGEARQNSETTIAKAQADADKLLADARGTLAGEEQRLLEAKQASVKYLESMRMLSVKHLDFLDKLGEAHIVTPPAPREKKVFPIPTAEAAPEPAEEPDDEAVRTIGDRVAHLAEDVTPELDVDLDIDGVEPVAEDVNPTRLYGV